MRLQGPEQPPSPTRGIGILKAVNVSGNTEPNGSISGISHLRVSGLTPCYTISIGKVVPEGKSPYIEPRNVWSYLPIGIILDPSDFIKIYLKKIRKS